MSQRVIRSKSPIFVVISFLIVALIYSSSATFVYALPPDPNFRGATNCTTLSDGRLLCCWRDYASTGAYIGIMCQACKILAGPPYYDCDEAEYFHFNIKPGQNTSTPVQRPTPVLPPGGGVLEVPPTDEGTAPQLARPLNETAPPTAEEGDADKDGVVDSEDNCISVANPGQEDTGGVGGIGDACEPTIIVEEEEGDAATPDTDGDSIPDEQDNCPSVANEDQQDSNDNGIGDACDQEQQPEEQPPAVDAPQDQAEQEEPQDQGQQDEGNDNDGGDTSNPEQEPEQPQ